MAYRTIKYLPKITQARTEYREISAEDHQWLQTEMIRWLVMMGQMDSDQSPDSQWVRDQWWHRRSRDLSRSQQGPNTPCSLISGTLFNVLFKQPLQRDLTHHQMEDLEQISHILAQALPDCEAVRFQVGFSE